MGKIREAKFSYHLDRDGRTACPDAALLAKAIAATFAATKSPARLLVPVPVPVTADHPPCADEKFRRFAVRLLKAAPGITFFVLGGSAPISREILLAHLPNLRAVCSADGTVSVVLPSDSAHEFFHDQLMALTLAGVPENEAIRELRDLSLSIGMSADHWR